METKFLKPKLYDISQGSRIAYVRQLRSLSRKDLAERLNIKGEAPAKSIIRYETGKRTPTDYRVDELSSILNVSSEALKKYSMESTTDLIYYLIWMDELFPGFNINLGKAEKGVDFDQFALDKFFEEIADMRLKLKQGYINSKEYLEWKLNYKIKKCDII